MPDQDIFDKVAAKPPKQDIFDQVAAQQAPDAVAQAQARFQPGGAGAAAVQYTPTRKFEMNVARGFGLDPDKLAAAESSGGNLSALQNIGGQAVSGVASALPGMASTLGNDPLKAITGPIDAMASNIVKPTGLPDTGSIFSRKGYTRPNPGQLMGALGATEAVGNVGEGIGEGIGKATGAIGKQIAKLSGETPERIAELKALPQQEAAINQKIAQAEVQSRTAFKAAYPQIDEAPVNVAATKNLAKQAGDNIVSARVPAQINRVGAIPEPPQNVLTSDDPNVILKELAGFDNIPFRKAQLYRTAIERYISQAGGKLPSDVYGQLKAVSGSLGDGLRITADREGQLAQFNTAEAMFKQHAADFWNKGAPLKPFANIPPDATGATVNKFLQTAQQGRILQALERRGVPTEDIKGILAKGGKQVRVDFRDAATLQNLGQPVLDQQVATANRGVAKKIGLGTVGGVTGVGALAEWLRRSTPRK